jgi:hypothetical protein
MGEELTLFQASFDVVYCSLHVVLRAFKIHTMHAAPCSSRENESALYETLTRCTRLFISRPSDKRAKGSPTAATNCDIEFTNTCIRYAPINFTAWATYTSLQV